MASTSKRATQPMTKKERVRAALRGEAVDRVPVAMWGHDYLREWTREALVEATLELYRAHDWDLIKLNPRWTHFAEAWGSTYEPPTEQRNPRTLTTTIHSAEDLAKLRPVHARRGVFSDHLSALELMLAEVGDEVDVVATVFSPLSVVGLLCGLPDDLLPYAASDPASLHSAIAAVTVTLIDYAEACIAAGAAGIFYAPLVWASADTCDEAFYREYGRPYDLQVLARVRQAELNILHVCRDHNMIDLLLDYPVAALNWADHGTGNPSLAEVKARTDKAVMGGIDQTRLAEMSTGEAAAQAEAALSAGPERLFVTGGCSISPLTPDANRAAVVSAVRG